MNTSTRSFLALILGVIGVAAVLSACHRESSSGESAEVKATLDQLLAET